MNAIYFKPGDRSKWEIRILQGAKEQGNQWGPLHRASGIINTKLVKIAYLNVTDVENNKWKPQKLSSSSLSSCSTNTPFIFTYNCMIE